MHHFWYEWVNPPQFRHNHVGNVDVKLPAHQAKQIEPFGVQSHILCVRGAARRNVDLSFSPRARVAVYNPSFRWVARGSFGAVRLCGEYCSICWNNIRVCGDKNVPMEYHSSLFQNTVRKSWTCVREATSHGPSNPQALPNTTNSMWFKHYKKSSQHTIMRMGSPACQPFRKPKAHDFCFNTTVLWNSCELQLQEWTKDDVDNVFLPDINCHSNVCICWGHYCLKCDLVGAMRTG